MPGGAKPALRRRLLDARRTRPEDCTVGAALGAAVLGLPEVAAADTVAAYVSMRGEPPTEPLLDRLHRYGKRVILPIPLPNGDLDWSVYDGPASLRRSGGRPTALREPVAERLGPAAVREAQVIVVPGVAVGADGTRLGRGGGSYDRALTRADPAALVVLLLWDDELLDAVPAEPHDRQVHAVVTPTVVHRFPGRPG